MTKSKLKQGIIPGLPSGSPAQYDYTLSRPKDVHPAQDFVSSVLRNAKAGMASFLVDETSEDKALENN